MEQWTIHISPYFTNLNLAVFQALLSSNSEDSYFSHLCSPFPPIGIDNFVWELHDPDDLPSASFFRNLEKIPPGTSPPWHHPNALGLVDRSSTVEGHLVELYQASLIRKPSETRIRHLVGVEIFDKNVVGWHNASLTGWAAIYIYSIVTWMCDGPACQTWVFVGNQLDLRAAVFGGVAISLTYIDFSGFAGIFSTAKFHNLFVTFPGFECQWGECYHYFRVTCHDAAAHNMIHIDK